MVVWNWRGGIWSLGCLFALPRWGKSKQGVLNAIGRPSSTRLFALLGKANPKWWYETDLVEFDPNGVYSLRPDGESRNKAYSTQLAALRQPGFFRCLEKPTQNGGMKPTWWNLIPRVFIRFAPMGKGETRCFERNWTTFVNPASCAAWKSPPKMVVWNRPGGIWSLGCLFASPGWGKWKQGVLNDIGRPSLTRLFALLGKPHPKWRYETDLVGLDPKGVYSLRPDGEIRNKVFWTQLDDLREPGFLRFLEKPTQNGGIKQTWWNSISMVFIRFASMGKVETRRFERNWMRFVNPTFSAAWKSPPKMVVWNRPGRVRSQGCLFASPQGGKSKQGVLNAIGRPSSTWLFAMLGKAHPKWWYEPDVVEFDPKGVYSLRPDGESRNKAFWTQLDDLREPYFLRCLEKPTQNADMKPTWWDSIPRMFIRFAPMGKVKTRRFERNWTKFVNPTFCAAWKSPPKMVVWNPRGGIRSQGCLFASPLWGKSKKAFWTQLDDLRQPGFLLCLEKPTQNGGMKPTLSNSIPRVFIRFAPMGKVETRRFERNCTTFVNPTFCVAWKSPPKMLIWNRRGGTRSQGCLFASPRLGKSKQGVLNAIGRPSSTRLFALLGKAHPKWWCYRAMRIVYCFRFHRAHEGVFALFVLICISVVVDYVLHSSLRFRRYCLRRCESAESVASFSTIFLHALEFHW